MGKKDGRVTVRAGQAAAESISALHAIRQEIDDLKRLERAVRGEVEAYIGDADVMVTDDLCALLVRCEGQVSWKEVVTLLVQRLDIPPSVVAECVGDSTGAGHTRLMIRERGD